MAQQITSWIYGQNNNDWGESGGILLGFPTQKVLFFPLKPTVSMSGATMKTKIKVLGNGNDYDDAPEFYTDKTVTDLVTASNA